MYDDVDLYVSRCLKNWVAKHRLPGHGRSLLLQAVLEPPTPQERLLIRYLAVWRNRCGTQSYVAMVPHRDWRYIGPFTHSPLWTFQLATDLRLAQ